MWTQSFRFTAGPSSFWRKLRLAIHRLIEYHDGPYLFQRNCKSRTNRVPLLQLRRAITCTVSFWPKENGLELWSLEAYFGNRSLEQAGLLIRVCSSSHWGKVKPFFVFLIFLFYFETNFFFFGFIFQSINNYSMVVVGHIIMVKLFFKPYLNLICLKCFI